MPSDAQFSASSVLSPENVMYSEILGTRMTLKLQRKIAPRLEWNQQVYGKRVLSYLKPGIRWLDLGCGDRLLCGGLEKLESELARYPFVGVDLDLENLRAQRHTEWRVQADANHLPFRSECFNLITANMVVEHLRNPELTFRELNRVLAPGGTIVLHTPNLTNYLVFGNRVLSRMMSSRIHAALVATSEDRSEDEIYPTFYRANTRGKLHQLVEPTFRLTVESMPGPRPFFHYFVPVALVELMLTRLTQTQLFQRFATTLLVTMQKPAGLAELFEMPSIREPESVRSGA
jgi:ubiquinone/menaquinone biosynthesis C-methylase UbiE